MSRNSGFGEGQTILYGKLPLQTEPPEAAKKVDMLSPFEFVSALTLLICDQFAGLSPNCHSFVGGQLRWPGRNWVLFKKHGKTLSAKSVRSTARFYPH